MDDSASKETKANEADEAKETEAAKEAEGVKAGDAKAGDAKASDDKAGDDTADEGKKGRKAKKDKKDGKAIEKGSGSKAKRHMPKWVAILIVAVLALGVGLGIGYYAFGGASAQGVNGKTTVTEDELDDTMATYTYDGKTYEVTVSDVIKTSSSLDAAKNDDDTYNVPSADDALSYARSAIIQKVAEDKGIEVTDDELDSYAESTLGSSDYDSIASSYSMDVEDVKALIKQSAEMSELRDQVVETESMDAPTAPDEPEDGDSQTASADYAQYIIDLAGDEWDSETGTWASTDGDYATALADYTITNDSATYEAAQAAYYVAYQKYSENQSEISSEWTDYVNNILCDCDIQISTLMA